MTPHDETARAIVDRYNAGFIDQENNVNRPALVKWIKEALREAHAQGIEDQRQLVCTLQAALKEIININDSREPGPIYGYHTWSMNMEEAVNNARAALVREGTP
jgi:hypothetical protein